MTCDHSKRRRRHETTIRLTFVVVAVVESIGWWISGEFSFWWFSLLFLVTTIWYSSQSANALKGFRLVTSMTAVFCLFGALSGFDFEFTGIPKALASSLGNILKVVSILWSVFAYCWSRRLSGEKSKSSDRSRIIEQVHLACKEVLEEEDSNFTVYSKIVHICLAEAQYKYCRKLLQKGRKLDVKLGHYFKIYVDCAQFYDLGRIHVDGRSFTSNDTQDFKQYMENRFLAIVGLPLQVWELFRRNDLVCRFIRVKTIENRKPKSKLRSFLDSLRYVVFSLVIVSLVVGPLPATGFGCLLPVFRKVFLYPKKRLTEARLQFVLAFQPYTQDKYRLHYAAHLYDVAQRIGRYEGTRNAAGSLQLDAGTIGRLIEIYELILSFEETRSTVYCAATTELGHLYYCDGQFERAKEAYEKALERVTDLGDRDYLLRRIVEILQNTNEEVVLSLLEEIERSPNDYPRSRPFLSKVYLLKGDYAALERIVRAVNTDLQAPDYFFLGKCHAHKDDPEKAMESFLQAEKRVREHEDQRVKTLVACGLGAWYLSEGRFSDAADMYCCFFVTKVMNDFWLDESQTKENLKRLSECIDRVIKERPGDARLCLWQFLFHHIGGDTKKAEPFLEMYLSSTNMYEYEFKRFLKRRLRAAGPVSSGL